MEKREIEIAIQRLKDQLDETMEERYFVLTQSGHHIPGHTVKEYDAAIEKLERKINHLRQLLVAKEEKAGQ